MVDASPLLPGLVGGGAVGYVVGWGAKKIFKILLTIVGIIATLTFAITYWVESQGIITITVDYSKLETVLQGGATWAAGQGAAVTAFATQFDAGIAGLAGGAILGWKRA